MASNPDPDQIFQNLELLTEHFGFVPTCFIDDVINAANDIIHQALEGLESYLVTKMGQLEAEKVPASTAPAQTACCKPDFWTKLTMVESSGD